MGEKIALLKEHLGEITNLQNAGAVLGWDESTYMPAAGARARGEQMGTIGRIAHEMFISAHTQDLLDGAASELNGQSPDSDEARLIRVIRRDYELDRRIPPSLIADIHRHASVAYQAWAKAREQNDFAAFAPYLQKTIELSREVAEHLGYTDQLYDALLDQFEPGMKTAEVQRIFEDLKKDLLPLYHAILERVDQVDDAMLHQHFPEDLQEEFGKKVSAAIGYDFSRGRLDRTVHPFEVSFSRDDVRITTRYDSNFLNVALFGTMHESGHAMYEQGIGESLEGTPLGHGASLGSHESQSRLWENIVGRSRGFWQRFFPELRKTFPQQLESVDQEAFYRAINKVERSLIRVEADEVSYNLHIMLRLEMEIAMLSGELKVADAPDAWDEKMQAYMGIKPPNNSLGILQDVHWSHGMMGYFTTYSLGNLLSAQLFAKAVADVPGIPEDIRRGEFGQLRSWLTEKVYKHGRKFEPQELIERATGEPLQARAYIAYLKNKFGEIYDLPTA